MKYFHPVSLLLLTTGTILLVYAAFSKTAQNNLSGLEKSRGYVFALVTNLGDTVYMYSGNSSKRSYAPLVRFVSNEGEPVSFQNKVWASDWSFYCHDSIDVYYPKGSPQLAMIKENNTPFYKNYPFIIGCVVLLAGLSSLRERVKWVKKKEREDPEYFKKG